MRNPGYFKALAFAMILATTVACGKTVGEAIDAPRMHPEGPTLHLEGGWDDTNVYSLDEEFEVVRWSGRNLFFGGVQAVELGADGSLAAAGDPRRGGAGVVVS